MHITPQSIELKIRSCLKNVEFFEIINQSQQHADHYINTQESEAQLSHIVVVIASSDFKNTPILERHKIIFKCLKDEFKIIHSISLKLMDIDQFNIFKKSKSNTF